MCYLILKNILIGHLLPQYTIFAEKNGFNYIPEPNHEGKFLLLLFHYTIWRPFSMVIIYLKEMPRTEIHKLGKYVNVSLFQQINIGYYSKN